MNQYNGGQWPPQPEFRARGADRELGKSELLLSTLRDEFVNKKNVETTRFDPGVFDLKRAQQKIDAAVRRKTSKTKSESTNFNMHTLKIDPATNGALFGKEYLKPQKEKKLLIRGIKACAVCGITAGLNRCRRCLKVAYCGPECQRKDWKRHKVEECIKKAAKKSTS